MKLIPNYRLPLALFCVMAVPSLITRVILLIKSIPNLDMSLLLLVKIFTVGFFFDIVAFSYFLIPFALLRIIVPDSLTNCRLSRGIIQVFFFLYLFAMLFNIASEYIFFNEFATRYNFIAVDYLIYTTEVVRNIRESYPVTLITTVLAVITIIPFLPLRRYLKASFPVKTTFKQRLVSGLIMLTVPLTAYNTVKLSYSEISPNNYANELAENGLYGFASAFRNNELDFDRFYATKDNTLVMNHLRNLLKSSDNKGLSRQVRAKGPEHHYNIILICEESLSAEFLGTFGSKKGLTPNLDRLAGESMLFTHLYASGTRTVRGLEAITLSIPPLPGTAIVKRPGNEGIFSWGSVMRNHGYDNHFIYGGRGYFDNMNYFFGHNGFTTIDQTDFAKEEISFKNAWGVCDEDLFDKTIKQADLSHSRKKPFFSYVMTTSNHRPYTYPAGKVDIPSGTGRDGAIKYTDYAVGRLMEKSQSKPWFRNTIFIIVADHCAGSARKLALPIKNYEIPMIVYAPAILKPDKIDTMMSQIDIAPTILGLLNSSYNSSFFGRDIFNDQNSSGRAFIGTYQKLGYMEKDRLLILDPGKKVEYFSFTRTDGRTTPIQPDSDLLMNALAYYQGSAFIYRNRLNQMTSTASTDHPSRSYN